jgi:hypothetical protein
VRGGDGWLGTAIARPWIESIDFGGQRPVARKTKKKKKRQRDSNDAPATALQPALQPADLRQVGRTLLEKLGSVRTRVRQGPPVILCRPWRSARLRDIDKRSGVQWVLEGPEAHLSQWRRRSVQAKRSVTHRLGTANTGPGRCTRAPRGASLTSGALLLTQR